MKKAIVVIMLMMVGIVSAQTKNTEWSELKAFHTVMSQTFHPSEDGNLKPVKERSGELVEKAEALKESAIPAQYNTKDIKIALYELVAESKKLDNMVKAGKSDKKITKELEALHHVFHKIAGLCNDKH
ncbi:hypothetical protein ACLI1A_12380 [Flavobacterium sp. RHBU_3]|uniref:hypothetical protein n=1 Tax=Flavobacterium sp. RHBU_3 TaxID=3391184 RepID=UPI0039856369